MVEVFRTNVDDRDNANMLVAAIHETFVFYSANFDLEDRDNILRVECHSGYIQTSSIIDLLRNYGFSAEVLQEGDCYDPFAKLRRWI